jgi:putative spermidine/putrescine transport system ATP-binding protein
MSAAVEIRNLSRRYGPHVHALKDVSLAVTPGEFVTLLGPSGSGKSTILKLIAGFEAPSGGDILIDGRSVIDLPSHQREIGMVFQNYALFPHMSVAENIAFPLRCRRCQKEEINRRLDSVLEMTRLQDLRDRMPHEISGGQQQRVALARAIIFNPKILLMDEPLSALDRHLREQMKSEIKRVQQDMRMTVLFVTHDQDEALALSDRVGVMRHGRLEQIDPPHRLYGSPGNRFIAEFVGEANVLSAYIRDGQIWLFDQPVMPAAASLATGPCWLLLRPERLSMSRDPDHAGLTGRVAERIFLGESSRYLIAVGAARIALKQQNRGAAAAEVGDIVKLYWSPDDAVILRDQ